MKTVLITGIAGFIGLNLSREFLKRGWGVDGFDDLSVGRKEWLPEEVVFDQYNVCDHLGGFGHYDLIVHLASKKIPRDGDSRLVLTENTRGLETILSYALTLGSKFIYLSSSDVYGKSKQFVEGSDFAIGQPHIRRWSYAISKMWGEQLLYSTPEDFNFNIVRLFGTYGPYHALSWKAGPQSDFISQALKKEPLTIYGTGYQKRAYQYVDDAVDGIMRLVESDCNREVFNIGNPTESITVNDLAEKIWGIINPGEPIRLEHTPQSPFQYEEVQARVPDILKAKDMLGFYPRVGLDEGLRKTIEWQREVV